MKKIQQEKVSGLCSIHLHCEPLTLSRSPYQYHRRYYIIHHPTCIEWTLHDSNIQYMLFETLFCSISCCIIAIDPYTVPRSSIRAVSFLYVESPYPCYSLFFLMLLF